MEYIREWCIFKSFILSYVVWYRHERNYAKGLKFRGGSRTATTSKMEHFVIIVNGFQSLTIITKRSIILGYCSCPRSVSELFLFSLDIRFCDVFTGKLALTHFLPMFPFMYIPLRGNIPLGGNICYKWMKIEKIKYKSIKI